MTKIRSPAASSLVPLCPDIQHCIVDSSAHHFYSYIRADLLKTLSLVSKTCCRAAQPHLLSSVTIHVGSKSRSILAFVEFLDFHPGIMRMIRRVYILGTQGEDVVQTDDLIALLSRLKNLQALTLRSTTLGFGSSKPREEALFVVPSQPIHLLKLTGVTIHCSNQEASGPLKNLLGIFSSIDVLSFSSSMFVRTHSDGPLQSLPRARQAHVRGLYIVDVPVDCAKDLMAYIDSSTLQTLYLDEDTAYSIRRADLYQYCINAGADHLEELVIRVPDCASAYYPSFSRD